MEGLKNTLFFHKSEGSYLEQIKNNSSEKTSFIIEALYSKKMPEGENGKCIILELGPGGGESMKEIEKAAKDAGAELIAVDFIPEVVAFARKKNPTLEGIVADGGVLPIKDNTISAINASAVFHEISSYGTFNLNEGEKIYGKETVKKVLVEANRVLVHDGILAYRDVLAPKEGIDKIKTVEYAEKSWIYFCKYFLEYFKKSQKTNIYKEDDISMREDARSLSIAAPAGVHREIQRHYITFRDYLRTIAKDKIGIKIEKKSWIDKQNGLKNLTIEIETEFSEMINKYKAKELEKSEKTTSYEISSDEFDRFYDEAIAYFFHQAETKTNRGELFSHELRRWSNREGGESYVYGNFSDMLLMATEVFIENHDMKSDEEPYVLFPKALTDMRVASRAYYNYYLNDVLESPEYDGKQMICFRKIKASKALEISEKIKKSNTEGSLVDNKTLDKIIDQLKNALK
jgi:ubiquinone/menaquinone biosynthesis C-methylase UbiE